MGDRETDGTWWVHDIEASKNGPGRGPAEHELCLDFQPRFSLENGRLCGAEALARWDHPILGRLAAAEFVGEAEANRFVGDLDAFVIAAACVQLKKWESGAGLPPGFSLSVNISAQDLDDPGFARRTASASKDRAAWPSTSTPLGSASSPLRAFSTCARARSAWTPRVSRTCGTWGAKRCWRRWQGSSTTSTRWLSPRALRPPRCSVG